MGQDDRQQFGVLYVECPVCENTFSFGASEFEIGDILECPVCGSTLEIADFNDEEGIILRPIVKGK